MNASQDIEKTLRTTVGDFPLDECRLSLAGREWTILHVGAVLSREQETSYLLGTVDRLPYGVTLWASAIALANEIAARGASFRGKRVLELGAGTGLPGIIAASFGARVLQTDRNELALALARRNVALNRLPAVEQRALDWTDWRETGKYDWIVGSDILYGAEIHPHLRRIFETNLAPGGRVLIADPFRASSLELLEALETGGWAIGLTKWSIGEEKSLRTTGVFELTPPA
jgi:methyltransferase-like protein 23